MADRRVEIIQHAERLGWSGNVNSLLECVDTPLFFLYFHDDLILPQYCAELRSTLLRRPNAASAHCDVLDFGKSDVLRPGRTYEGTVARRLLLLWTAPHRGALLRSVVRTEMIGSNFRLLEAAPDAFAPGHALEMRMVAAGPALHVRKTLYLRWIRRGGLIESWKKLPYEVLLEGRQRELAVLFPLVDEAVSDSDARRSLRFALTLYAYRKLAKKCRIEGRPPPKFSDLHPEAPDLERDGELRLVDADVAQWTRSALDKLSRSDNPQK